MRKTLLLILLLCSITSFSQTKKDTTSSIKLDAILISTQRFAKPKRKVTQQVESISKIEMETGNFQTSPDVLANSGILAVQKSQQGGGSPNIRGFEASRILLVVDGIRMNNLIYRAGHLQNSITVDKNILESIDVLFGPSSTIFGSDALGGAIYFQTRDPKLLSESNGKKLTGNFISNYSSSNNGFLGHLDLNYATEKWASLTSFSYNDYGDLKMGKRKNGSNDFFGERPTFVQTNNGVDEVVLNDSRYVQKFSGYKQYDFLQKIIYQQNENTEHSLNFQYSNSSDVPRYDRLTDLTSKGKLKFATWNYGPQKRLLSAYKLSQKKVFLNSDLNLTASYQNIEESRINRNFGNPNQSSRVDNVSVFAINADFRTKIGKGDFIYGADIYYDDLNSTGVKKNIVTYAETVTDSRYPDGKNNTFRAEGFISYSNDITKTASYNASARAGYTTLNSEIATNFLKLPYTTMSQESLIYSGAVGIVNNASKNSKIAFNLASGFRVPNIDDLAKIFDSSAGTLIVPNKNIKPEKSVTADLSITLWKGKQFQLENVFYYTRLYDAIIISPYLLNGQSSIIYEGENSLIYANQNQGNGAISGISSTVKSYITKSLLLYGTFNFTHGRVQHDNEKEPLDHIAPYYGKAGLKYESDLLNLDLYMLYNDKKKLSEYSPSGEDNLKYAPIGGTLSWQTYNLKATLLLSNQYTFFSGIENILDIQYRTFASGINASGRNIFLGGKYQF
ncbi:hemoglobin/transferrin/lactoferrin receptor protein [Flavobacterium sp. PL11]|uniref:TonB-dependent receptor plug domain-containing protein n=1 Tax=Flavobacterium sp. PL11 TaxID=3071717 RepID=UPI002DF78392|nr:hemoglobin/transferrin/lactoferrin receptor protein [Flavobacterium sp. PL11]